MALLIRCGALPVNELLNALSGYSFIKEVNIIRNEAYIVSHEANKTNPGESCSENLSGFDKPENTDFRKDWFKAADRLYELEESERSIIKSIGSFLGGSDIQGQLSMLEINSELLKRNGNEAREQYLKKGKLYRTFGLLAGLFAAVMIL
jgi:hypothetical protein